MIAPTRKYCSNACKWSHLKAKGHYKTINEKGNESQFVTKQTTGKVPGYEKRSRAVAESNSTNPRRKRKVVP